MAHIPAPDEVSAYLEQHKIETVIEEAVNDAVLKQVKNPFQHIASLLLKHDETKGGSGRRVSLGPATTGDASAEVKFSGATSGDEGSKAKTGEEISRNFIQKDDVSLDPELAAALRTFFDKMDADSDGSVTKEEAIKFWGKNFAKINATSMFNEVDEDGNGSVTWEEFLAFWKNVVGSGYDVDDLKEEVQMMMEGGSWVDFDDGRTT